MTPIYIEASDEITTVIERMKETPDTAVGLVIPKGAVLLQSIVNLKLAKRAAAEQGKQLTLVTTDKIGKNLAAQVGIPVSSTMEAAQEAVPDPASTEDEINVVDGVKVHRYYNDSSSNEPESSEVNSVEPIIPREIMKESPAPEPTNPITVRNIETPPPPPIGGEIKTRDITAKKSAPITPPKAPESPKEEVIPSDSPITPLAAPVIAAAAEAVPKKEASPKAEKPVAMKSPTPTSKPRRSKKALMFLAYILVLLLLGATGVSAFYLPKTSVVIAVPTESWSQDASVSASADSTTLPAELVTVSTDESVTQKATGEKELGETATGTAKIFNADSSDPKQLPAGTRILANGIGFVTTAAVTVPGVEVQSGTLIEGSTTVAIAAEQPGDNANMSSVTGTVPDKKVYAQIVSTSGGTSKKVAVVTQTDIANAKEAVIAKLKESTDLKMVQNLQDRTVIFDAKTDEFSSSNFNNDQPAGAQAESVTVKGTGTLKRLVVNKDMIDTAVTESLKSSQESGKSYVTDSIEVTASTFDMKAGTVAITAKATGRSSATIDTGSLPSQLTGKSQDVGKGIIQDKAAGSTITVTTTPSWWPIHNFPYSSKFLSVVVTYE